MKTIKIKRYGLIISLLCLVFIPHEAFSQEGRVYSLDECISAALRFSPQIKGQQHEVEIAKTRLEEADGYQFPQIEIMTLFGPSPKARGNQINSDYRNDGIEGLGVFGSADIKVVQPIYTFGKITEAKNAASHGIMVEASKVKQKATDVALEIKQYYYGHLAALEGEKLVDEIQGYLDSTIEKTKKLIESESGRATELDLNKLETYQGLLAKYRGEAEKNIILSKDALRTFMGLDGNAIFSLKDEALKPVDADVRELKFYSEKSKELRPEFAQLREGLKAKESLLNMAKADYYPKIFAAAFYSYSDATERDRVTNPWIYDYFRHQAGGAALGMKWNFDFGITGSQVHRARADYLKLQSLHEHASAGIPLQVEKSYREMIEAKNSIEATRKAFESARKWMIGAVMNYDMGIGEAKDAADAIAAYGNMKEQYIKSVYNFNMSYANVLQASGLAGEEISYK
ncbi:MAG: TolC family protein [Nitrospirae bacterium]|nr:TolC family protein [Nitrospirota bacterium]